MCTGWDNGLVTSGTKPLSDLMKKAHLDVSLALSKIHIIPPHWHDTVELLLHQELTYYIVSNVDADVLVMQGARASTIWYWPCWTAIIWSNTITHWGRLTHIYVSNLTITASDNGVSPGRRQDIIWTNVGILLIGPLGTNFSEILIDINTSSFNKMPLKMSPGKWSRPQCVKG